jgi:hypothetical protein
MARRLSSAGWRACGQQKPGHSVALATAIKERKIMAERRAKAAVLKRGNASLK